MTSGLFQLRRGCALLAVSEPRACAAIAYTMRGAGVPTLVATDRAELFEALTAAPETLVIGDHFDGARVESLLAMIRTAGCRIHALVMATRLRPALAARLLALQPIEVVGGPFDGATLRAAVLGREPLARRARG